MKRAKAITCLATALCTPEVRVKTTMRWLVEAGLFTTGARGVNAPELNTLDIARIVIAFLASEVPGKESADIVRTVGSLPWANRGFPWSGEEFTLATFFPGFAPSNLEQGVAMLIQAFILHQNDEPFKNACRYLRDGSVRPPDCTIEVFKGGSAGRIQMNEARYDFHSLPLGPLLRTGTEQRRLGVQRIGFIDSQAIIEIASAFGSYIAPQGGKTSPTNQNSEDRRDNA